MIIISIYKNSKNEIEHRNQNIIIIYHKDTKKYLDYNNSTQYGLDCTFKIIPKSLKPYKLMTVYTQ